MFPRIFILVVSLFLVLFPGPCFSKTVGFLIPSSGLGDQSFNDMTYSGLIQARNVYNFRLIREQAARFDEISRQKALDKLLSKKADIIIMNGFEFESLIRKYAPEHPDTLFIIHDIKVEGIDNIASTVFNQYQGSCLAGALAAWMTTTKKVGFIGGMDIPVIREFLSGYEWGIRYVADDVQLQSLFLSDVLTTGYGFDTPETGYREAEKMYRDGVDIIFSAAGLSGNGVIGAARKYRKFAIGVDADQDHMAKGYVLTSVMKRLDKATIDLLDRIQAGEKISGVYHYGLQEGGISLSPMIYTQDIVPQEVHAKLEALTQKLIRDEGERR